MVECQRQSLNKRVRVDGDHVPSIASLEETVRGVKDKLKKAQVEKDLAASLAQHMEEMEAEQRQEPEAGILGNLHLGDEEADEDDSEQKRKSLVDVDIGAKMRRLSAKAKPKEAKDRKSSGGAKKRAHASVAESQPARSSVGARDYVVSTAETVRTGKRMRFKQPEGGAGDAASAAGGSGKSPKNKDEQFIGAAKEKMGKVDMSCLLGGQAYGNELYHIRRCQQALEKTNQHSVDLLEVNAFLALTAQVTKLQAGNIAKMPVSECEELIRQVQREVQDLEWPGDVQMALLVSRVRKLAVDMDIPALQEAVRPWSALPGAEADAKFDPLLPLLARTSFEDVTMGKAYLRLVVCEVLVPIILQSKDKQGSLEEIVSKLKIDVPHGTGTVLSHAVSDANGCCDGVAALVCSLPSKQQIAHLDNIMVARDGTKAMLRQAILQTPFYKALESTLRQAQVAHATLGPLLQERQANLEANKAEGKIDMPMLHKTLEDLPTWSESLRAGATGGLESIFCDLCLMAQNNPDLNAELATLVAAALPVFLRINEACCSEFGGDSEL